MPVLSRAVITIAEVVEVARGRAPVSFARPVELDLAASRAVVEKIAASGVAVYGLNTELGAGRDITVGANALEAFQQRVVRNSSGGVGEPLSEEQARAVIYARLVGFTRGGAGVTPALAAQYRELLNRGVYPFIPRTGSVGSADLTHLAAIAAVAAGSGRAIVEGSVVPGQAALEAAGLAPHVLQAHEGLAALSSNAFSVGVGALVVTDARATIRAADAAVALALTALASHSGGGSASPFSEVIQAAHPSPGQAASAARVRGLLGTVSAASVQDPISFRSAPQITGAAIEAVERAASLVALELNSRTENPLVDIETATMTSGGNFQVLGLALSFEALRLALAHVAGASERRLAKLSSLSADARRSGTARVPGLSWYSSSVLVAELNHLANPVTLGGSSLSDDVEDHSSHAALALQLLERSVALTRTVLAIEALTAAELVLLADAAPASALQTVVDAVRTGLDAGLPVDELVTTLEAALLAVG
ncbi:MAG: phenylalanine ammonia-lyase [Glaciihabitans sp.]|nr:phenylalanine ammonia-lyase [Glaciihabitans sp.]